MDIHDIDLELNNLAQEREKYENLINKKREEREMFDKYRTYESGDEYIDKVTRKKAQADYNRLEKKIKELEQKRMDVVDKEAELIKERTFLFFKVHSIKEDISHVNNEIRNYNSKMRELAQDVITLRNHGADEIAINALLKQIKGYQEEKNKKVAELEELKYEGSIIFDKSKKKEEPVSEEVAEEEKIEEVEQDETPVEEQAQEEQNNEQEEVSARNEVIKDFSDLDNKTQEEVVDPTNSINETGEYNATATENNNSDNNEEKKKYGVLDTIKVGATEVKDRVKAGIDAIKNGKLDLTPEDKKRPKFIKNIVDWTKNHPAVMGIAAGAIAVALIAGGPIAALASTAGEAAVGYVAYKSTLGKGR